MLVTLEKRRKMLNLQKLPPAIEDLRAHSVEQLAELRLL